MENAYMLSEMIKRKLKSRKLLLLSIIVICAIFYAHLSYAQTKSDTPFVAPEPGSIILLSTGVCGWLVRFARKRFHEFKRFFDILVGSCGLVLAVPIIAFTGIIIKIVSPGPILFKQARVGLNKKVFDMYKVRTMKIDAEKNTGPVWAQEDDPRLIKFGRIIRKLHLDELPQFFNVLRGEMSIVGPRPERPVFVKEFSRKLTDYSKRLNVKPGITGLAQVLHKYDETIADVKKKVKYDLLYIREMCLMVDIRILLRTIVVAVTGKGAR
ncbi:MAG: sugar transferase [Omnitrophica bacterium]|nr:sugar transferase [Candidatus Omnitrophota bacterium]